MAPGQDLALQSRVLEGSEITAAQCDCLITPQRRATAGDAAAAKRKAEETKSLRGEHNFLTSESREREGERCFDQQHPLG